MNERIMAALNHWPFVAPLLQCPQTEANYQAMVEALDTILDTGGLTKTTRLPA